MFVCKKCGEEKSAEQFAYNAKGRRTMRCRGCTNLYMRGKKQDRKPKSSAEFRKWRLNNRGKALCASARYRASTKGLPFQLNAAEIQYRIDRGFCEATAIPFDLGPERTWNSPSLDRIDSTKGYTTDNVRVVLWAMNAMANTWGEDTILNVADAIRQRRRILEESNSLSRRLAAKMREMMPDPGSTLYKLTWSEQVMPSGRIVPTCRASAARTSGNDCTGWPTPRQADGEKNVRSAAGSASEMERKGGPQDMSMAVSLCGWMTPRARGDAGGSRWETGDLRNLEDQCRALPGPIRYTVHGEMLTGCSAQMASGGQLNPALPRWLMAFPEEWERSAPGWSSWSVWQDVMHAALEMQSGTASEA